MEPRPFSRGYTKPPVWIAETQPRFNGATAFQPWIRKIVVRYYKYGNWLQWSHGLSAVDTQLYDKDNNLLYNASMEPRPFSRGYQVKKGSKLEIAVLQWSHGLSAVDTETSEKDKELYQGFNGATAFQPWIHNIMRINVYDNDRLQWSHGLSAVDTQGNIPIALYLLAASMEPRPFSRGYILFVMADILSFDGFNGATAFQPWIRA